jgi:outer membrane protein OmpA-like peptidoglycan-associated protein
VGVRVDGRMVLVPEIRTATFTQDFEALAGVYGRLGWEPEKPPEPPKPVDTDGDGFIDKEDRCPAEAGIKENDGCPDKDADGDSVVDRLDKCPDKAGPVENGGCPDTDADGDGVFDRLDKCPSEPGPKANGGCPDTDTDGDGIVDRLDKCPAEPETINNYKDSDGCPDELPEKLAKFIGKIEGIRFAPNRAVLLPQSFPVLDKAVEALQENSSVRVEISGHTDNIGQPAQNQALSQQRADAVRAYLESKGVSPGRLIAVGHGSTRPIADNRTEAGRTQNRRVEFQLLPGTRSAVPPKPVAPTAPAETPGTPPGTSSSPATPTPAAPTPALIPQKLAQFVGKLEGVRFMPNQPVLLPQSFPVLNKVAEALKESPTLRIEISGHTDNVGAEAQNQTLSQQRAETVKTYLESKGVEAARLVAVGFGATRPIADNNTETGRAQNRRVELRVLPPPAGETGIPVVPSNVPSVVPADQAAPTAPASPSAPLLPGEPNPGLPAIPPPPAIPNAPAVPIAPNVQAPPSLGAPTPPAVPSPPPAPPPLVPPGT